MNEVSIIKDAMQKIEELVKASSEIKEIDGHTYLINDGTCREIHPDFSPLPMTYEFLSLDGLVKIIRKEHANITMACETPDVLYINVTS